MQEIKKIKIKIGASEITFKQSGCGRPLVLIHTDHTYPEYFLSHLPKEGLFQVLKTEIPGFYNQASGLPITKIDQFLDLLEQAFNQLNLGKIDLMGKCLGAALVLAFAAKYPQRVRRIVAVALATKTLSPTAKKIGNPTLSFLNRHQLWAIKVRKIMNFSFWRRITNFMGGYYNWLGIFKPGNTLIRKTNSDPKVFFGVFKDYLTMDIKKILKKVDKEVLFINGDRDLTASKKEIIKLTQINPEKFSYAIVPKANHALVFNNTEEFNQIVTKFLLTPSKSLVKSRDEVGFPS